MITNLLSTQAVGSTSTESTSQSGRSPRNGPSFGAVLERSAHEEKPIVEHGEQASSDPEVSAGEADDLVQSQETETSDDASAGKSTDTRSLKADETSDSKETGEDDSRLADAGMVPPEKPIDSKTAAAAEVSEPKNGLAAADLEGKAEEQPILGDPDTVEKKNGPEGDATVVDAGGLALSGEVAAPESAEDTLPRGPAGVVPAEAAKPAPKASETAPGMPGATDTAQTQQALAEVGSEVEATRMATSRANALSEQQARAGTSEVLEAHRASARTPRAEVTPPRADQTLAATTVPPKPAPDSADDADIRLRDMSLTAAQTQNPTAAPQAGVRTQAPTSTRVIPALSAVTSSGMSGQALSGGTALASSSAIVQGVFGMSEGARTGDDVVSQRGAEVFALPQLLAEATVRSGASSFRAEAPRYVAQQLAEAVATAGKRNVDVSLNPKELGHVNMRLVTNDTGVSVVIQAERPETEDLMRRHIQDLAREFKEMGFTDISFQFGSDTEAGQSGGNDGSGQSGGARLSGDGEALTDEQAGQPLSHQLNISADGLDMRI